MSEISQPPYNWNENPAGLTVYFRRYPAVDQLKLFLFYLDLVHLNAFELEHEKLVEEISQNKCCSEEMKAKLAANLASQLELCESMMKDAGLMDEELRGEIETKLGILSKMLKSKD